MYKSKVSKYNVQFLYVILFREITCWAALSVALIFYILKAQEKKDTRQEEREINYQNIISKLTYKFNIVEDVKRDVEDIKEFVFKKEK